MRTNTGLTLYNKHLVDKVETYQRTHIGAVEWENTKNANVLATGGNIAADQAVIYIPFTVGLAYLKPKEWQALEDKSEKWTLQVGDFVVKGLVADEIAGNFQITQLKAKYNDVLQITSVDTMDIGSENMRHWKLSAK